MVVVMNLELPHESPICDFSCRLPENPDTLYLNAVGIPSPTKITITNKIDLCNYDENGEDDKYEWEVDSDG